MPWYTKYGKDANFENPPEGPQRQMTQEDVGWEHDPTASKLSQPQIVQQVVCRSAYVYETVPPATVSALHTPADVTIASPL